MMTNKNLIVFIDSSTRRFYIAVRHIETKEVFSKTFTHKELKGEALLSVISDLFKAHGYAVEAIKLLCTTSGPGSLTGLRICMSTIKTMAQVLAIPVVTLPTLFALEASYVEENKIAFEKVFTVLMARKNHYYIRERHQPEESFQLMKTEELLQKVHENALYVVEQNSTPLDFCDKCNIKCVNIAMNPEIIMELCLDKLISGNVQNYLECLPEYGGKSVAEINFEKRHKQI